METEASSGILGSASYLLTEEEFITRYRAIKMAESESYDSWVNRFGVIFFGHFGLLLGFMITIMWLYGTEGANGPIPVAAVAMNLGIAAFAGWALYSKIYCYRRAFKSSYRSSPFRGEKAFLRFTPLRLIHEDKLTQGSTDWKLVPRAVELRDGFVLMWDFGAGTWIPKHALSDSFGPDELADLLRSKIKKYKVIDRFAALRQKSKAVEQTERPPDGPKLESLDPSEPADSGLTPSQPVPPAARDV